MENNKLSRKTFTLADKELELWVFIDSENNPWFKAKEIATFLEYKDTKYAIRDCIKDYNKKTWENIKNSSINAIETPSNWQPSTIFINESGIKELLSKSRILHEPGFIEKFAEIFGFENDVTVVYRSKEQEFIGAIMKAFRHKKYKQQFTIDRYRIDLYFPDEKIAIECDELGHKNRDPYKEFKRESFIQECLGCRFIRFNPDDKNFSIYDVINKLILAMYENSY